MSEQVAEPGTEGAEEKESILLSPGETAFGSLMDALVADDAGTPADSSDKTTEPAADGAAAAAPSGEEKAGGDGAAAAAPAGDEAASADDSGGADDSGRDGDAVKAEPGGGDLPAEWTADAAQYTARLGEISTALETRVAEAYHEESLAAVKEEHAKYFEALTQHPRLLVGEEVPSTKGEGFETLRDTKDAEEWQEAVKSLLVEEVRARTTAALEENSDYLQTVHQSIELFQNNSDLIPGTKQFDKELADKFATMMKDYELRDDEEKLLGYSVPVQPIINSLRTDLAAARAAKPAAPALASEEKPKAQEPAATPPATPSKEEEPQAGIPSKAGNSTEEEDFSTLFGTIGLPNLRI